jgi:hypothetical protein
MATKKTSRKKSRPKKNLLATDPPILVGGGGSSFIWIRKDLDPQLVDPLGVPPNAPQPAHPDLYYCFRVQGNIGKVVLDDGNAGPPPGKSVNNQKYYAQFD